MVPNAKPTFYKSWSANYIFLKPFGVVTKVTYSQWLAPIFAVRKQMDT